MSELLTRPREGEHSKVMEEASQRTRVAMQHELTRRLLHADAHAIELQRTPRRVGPACAAVAAGLRLYHNVPIDATGIDAPAHKVVQRDRACVVLVQ